MRTLRGSLLLTVLSALATNAGAQVFSGSGLGPIPDGLNGTPPQYGAPRITGVYALDNSISAVDFVRMGALSVKTGASGSLRWDEFVSRGRTYIAP
jgi:hypothetical protein